MRATQLGERVRAYRDYWGARIILCSLCSMFLADENGGLTPDAPLDRQFAHRCEQCGEGEEE